MAERDYEAAIPLLTKLSALKEPQFQETATWAKQTLPTAHEQHQKLREAAVSACQKARALLKQHDYSGAVHVLELIPAAGRTTELQQLLAESTDLADECSSLRQEIEESLKRKKYSRLRPLLERYLKLKPDNAKMERLLRNLEKNHPARAVANFQETQTYYDVAGRLFTPRDLFLIVFVFASVFLAVGYPFIMYLNQQPQAVVSNNDPPTLPQPPPVPKPARLTIQQLPAVSLRPGESQRLIVRVERENIENTNGVVQLEFQGLPSMVTVKGGIPTVPSTSNQAEVELVADANANDANADVRVVATLASVSHTQSLRVNVTKPKPGERRVLSITGIEFPLRYCPPGKFKMGTPANELGRQDDENQVEVTLTRGFWMLETEVTQAMYFAVKQARPWQGKPYANEGANYPAVYVNWNDATDFCQKLTAAARREGVFSATDKFALPTEAQWEYAARAGTTTAYVFGKDARRVGDFAWYYDNTWQIGEPYAHQVGQKQQNPWELWDITGNVWEWCSDWYANRLPGGNDPRGPSAGSSRGVRGGSFNFFTTYPRVGYRGAHDPTLSRDDIGFRVVRVSE